MRTNNMFRVSIMIVFCWVNMAHAELCEQALIARINPQGLAFIAQEVKALIPEHIDLPGMDEAVWEWPFSKDDARIQTEQSRATVKLHDLRLQMEGDTLMVTARAEVATGGPVTIVNPYLGMGSAQCQAEVNLVDLALDLKIGFSTQGGRIKADVYGAKISMNDPQSVLALRDCVLGELLTSVLNFLRNHFQGLVQDQLESLAKEKIPALIAEKMDETLVISHQLEDYTITARLDGLQTDTHGVSLALAGDLTQDQSSPPTCLTGIAIPSPASCAGTQPVLMPEAPAMFGVGISEAMLNRALYTVWSSGKLCLSSASSSMPAAVGQGLDQLANVLGQPPGTTLSFALRLQSPPRIQLNEGVVTLKLPSSFLELSLVPPNAPAGEVGIVTDLSVSFRPWIDPRGNTIALELQQVAFNALEILGKGGTPESLLRLDPARIQRFIAEVAIPLLNERLAASPLSPAMIKVEDYLAELKLVQTGPGYLSAYLDAFRPSENGDERPPATVVAQNPPAVVGPQVLRLLVSGHDETTPSSFLRYSVRLDGGAWSEPKFGGRLDIVVTGGQHTIEVAAQDLAGNMDPNPQRFSVLVDDILPQLHITARPNSYLTTSSVDVAFTARDDRTPAASLRYQAQLYRVPEGGGQPALQSDHDLPPGSNAANFEDLEDGVYKLRIIVQDEAGNVTSEDVGFVIEDQGGCNTLPQRAPLLPMLLGLALFAGALRRQLLSTASHKV